MARLNMKTQKLMNDINGNFGANGGAHAKGCLTELADVFTEIRKTASELNGIWDDDAQRIFMEKLNQKTERIQFYIEVMNGFFDDLAASVNRVADWDAVLAAKLRDPHLKG